VVTNQVFFVFESIIKFWNVSFSKFGHRIKFVKKQNKISNFSSTSWYIFVNINLSKNRHTPPQFFKKIDSLPKVEKKSN